ncbi:MAG: DNA repair protein RecO [Verrucomicrobiales bacterium]|nr:DNA repair protein RecO [Verrucomicrobiales bacterium]
MPAERAHGIVLRCRPLSETSLIVHWLTREHGRLTTVAKGARRPKSAFRGQLDAFYRADFAFVRSRRSDLHTLTEVMLADPHPRLRTEYASLRAAAYAAQLIEQATEPETPLPGIFELLVNLLEALAHIPPSAATVLGFELRMLDELGLAPDLAQARLAPAVRELAEQLADSPSIVTPPPPAPAAVAALNHFLHGFLIYHLGRIPPRRAAVLAALTTPGGSPH